MATVRIGDFSGGTSEVLDPSLIAPNAAVASYNLDPRAGVFSPVLDALEVTTLSAPHIDWIEYDGGHTRLDAWPDASFVRWGDYLLYVYPGAVGANYAAKFNSTTGDRTESRGLGLAEVTAAENASVSLAPIRATALTFRDGEHNLTGDVLLNIEGAADDERRQYQYASTLRGSIVLMGESGESLINISEGDWVILIPVGGTESPVPCGRPASVVEVVSSEQITNEDGQSYPRAVVKVSTWTGYVPDGSNPQNILDRSGVTRGDAFGVRGFAAATLSTNPNEFRYRCAAVFKRSAKTLEQIVAFSLAFAPRLSIGYSDGAQFPCETVAQAEAWVSAIGGAFYTVPQALEIPPADSTVFQRRRTAGWTQTNGVVEAAFSLQLYDFTLYRSGTDATLIFARASGSGLDAEVGSYDLISYCDTSPGATDSGSVILGAVLPRSAANAEGLSSAVYRYAVTRVDDWGRESAPWPYLYEDKNRPKIDASTEAAAESTLGALFVRVGGLPQVPADWKLNIYRTRADGSQYYFLRKLDAGADFVDTVSDFDLSVVPMLAEQNYPPLVVPVDEEAKVFEQAPPQFLCEYRGVLFSAYKNRLMFSAPGKFYAWPPGNWYLLPSTITGILPAGDVLLVFTRTRTFRLTGNTFSTADFREVSDEYGCVANRTACLVDKRPFWCSLNGVATFDGVRVVVVTDGLLKDNSTRFAGAVAACSYRQEYYLILTPASGSKADASPTENESKSLHYLRFKPGAWLIHGRFPAAMTDIAHNPSDGCLYTVGGGKLWKLFAGKGRAPGFWKSGRLHGGIKGLVKTGQWWGVVVEEAPIRVTIEADGGTEITTRDLDPGSHYIDFRDGAEFRDLTFSFGGRGVVTEYSFEFQEGKPQ